MISAWSSAQRVVLGQRKVSQKSNEITAIPKLLELLELKGAVVTIDAMGTQRAIAAQIIAQEADYVLGLKGNQGTLHEEVALLFDEQQDRFAGHEVSEHRSCQKDHGRLEVRRVVATEQIAWLQDNHDWPGLRSIAKVESRRELIVEGKVEEETRYYISSLPADAKQIAAAVREHWGIENGLHWVMDMVFRDDECRIRSQHAPANFATFSLVRALRACSEHGLQFVPSFFGEHGRNHVHRAAGLRQMEFGVTLVHHCVKLLLRLIYLTFGFHGDIDSRYDPSFLLCQRKNRQLQTLCFRFLRFVSLCWRWSSNPGAFSGQRMHVLIFGRCESLRDQFLHVLLVIGGREHQT